ncbi:MAG: hypothetical protein ABFS56_20765 [Pseudomonadota bacterium]
MTLETIIKINLWGISTVALPAVEFLALGCKPRPAQNISDSCKRDLAIFFNGASMLKKNQNRL